MFSKIIDSEQFKQMKIFYKQNQIVFKFKFLLCILSDELKYCMTLKVLSIKQKVYLKKGSFMLFLN